jgi:hypothetical protein
MNVRIVVVCTTLALAMVVAAEREASAQALSGRNAIVQVNKKGKGKVVFLAKDAAIQAPSSPEGALLELCSPSGGIGTLDLPVENWTVKPSGSAKYLVKGKPTGVKTALIKPGKTLKVVGASVGGLDMTAPLGSLGVRLTFGTTVQCALFTGDAVRKDDAGKFSGKQAAPPADCSDATLGCVPGSPSGAFLQ